MSTPPLTTRSPAIPMAMQPAVSCVLSGVRGTPVAASASKAWVLSQIHQPKKATTTATSTMVARIGQKALAVAAKRTILKKSSPQAP
jgi:hypothetical protein